MVSFLDIMEQSTPSVIAMAISAHAQQIQANQSKLLSIVKIIFL